MAEANSNGADYRDQMVKVCGYATRQFENVQIAEFRKVKRTDDEGAVLGVAWSKHAPKTTGPEKRCITGEIIPKGGWDNYDRMVAGEPYDIVVGGGSADSDWKIHQKSLARD